MPFYRCYFLDREDHIRSRADIETADIQQAIERAFEMLKTQSASGCESFEIWEGDQRVYPSGKSADAA